jgi:hypothetical protein
VRRLPHHKQKITQNRTLFCAAFCKQHWSINIKFGGRKARAMKIELDTMILTRRTGQGPTAPKKRLKRR